ncbi:MAG: NAD(P)H-dependent oxidoreductase subunit E, partial [Candidatus Lokiarchaeota archaeon]|nr:NAD(P)H-dependent oxidoreductase subunit E [Candidatus Lokiarchaeota archaeon]
MTIENQTNVSDMRLPEIDQLLKEYKSNNENIITLLQEVQGIYGF